MRVELLIRQKRIDKGYTIDKLAKLAGMSKGHLSRIEREETDPSITTLSRIAIALKVKVEELYKIHY
ncbi:MAG: helix-turn-helix transcriptional regulator [Clostridia bacterium]|uniref:helix-turn-helix domain-containing protein n=1 Tax=Thomasclavelia cocleata TaxID=69824 RepID=UPI00272E70E2|nr:helix-turn-helix transcriptional regulator [Thomasclavelia cocleata]MCI8384785.1 helix-turn-helix transcriptional regulator [Clostridia bacterium]